MHSIHADHAHHDVVLIAGHAAGDLSDSDRATADALLSGCEPCAELRRDLVAIAAATRSLPAPALPARDFRLDPAQADRLRRGSRLRGLLRPFASTRSAVRPMAAAFTSLGLAGLFVATVLPGMFGSAASAPAQERDQFVGAGAPAPTAAPAATSAVQAAPESSGGILGPVAAGPTRSAYDYLYRTAGPGGEGTDKSDDTSTQYPPVAVGAGATHDAFLDGGGERLSLASAPTINPLIAGSLALLGIGLLLFGLRFAGRRLR